MAKEISNRICMYSTYDDLITIQHLDNQCYYQKDRPVEITFSADQRSNGHPDNRF